LLAIVTRLWTVGSLTNDKIVSEILLWRLWFLIRYRGEAASALKPNQSALDVISLVYVVDWSDPALPSEISYNNYRHRTVII